MRSPQRRVNATPVVTLQDDPPGRLRVRQGGWRAIGTINERGDIAVLEVGHRSKVYDR